MQKLWRGLYYAMWMSDKTPIQQELAHNLAKLVHAFSSSEMVFVFQRAFWSILQREWQGLDRLR
jgi:ribosomal RNA-processing protein 1